VPQPSGDVTVYVVLNDYCKLGIAYEETDPAKARPNGAAAGRRTGNSASGRSFTVVRFAIITNFERDGQWKALLIILTVLN
jgi:hypothetical protein